MSGIVKLENIRNDGYNMTRIAMLHLEEKVSTASEHLNRILSKYLSGSFDMLSSYDVSKHSGIFFILS